MSERLGMSATNLSAKDLAGSQAPDFVIDPDARQPELPLVVTIPATILMYVAVGIIYPIVGVIAAKDALARRFSRASKKSKS